MGFGSPWLKVHVMVLETFWTQKLLGLGVLMVIARAEAIKPSAATALANIVGVGDKDIKN